MVIIGRQSGGERQVSKASSENFTVVTAAERSRSSLHNFSLQCMKWGEQRQFRCVRDPDDGANGGNGVGDRFPSPNLRSFPTNSNRKRRSFFEPENFERSSSLFQPPPEFTRRGSISDNDGGIGAVTIKIVLDSETQVDRIKSAVLSVGSEEIEPPKTTRAEEARPWNLRTRRPKCKDPSPSANGVSGGTFPRVDERIPRFSRPTAPTRRTDVDGGEHGDTGREKRPSAELRIPLTKNEIEDDFVAMTGIRPPRKPKKRPRHVQKQVDRFFPGLWLSKIKASMYIVNENTDGAKR